MGGGEMDLIQRDGVWWPADDEWCWKVIHQEVPDVDAAVAYASCRDVAVQAGGNVGVWAAHLAKLFAAVDTVEPVAANYECLTRNVPSNVRHAKAVFGEAPGRIAMNTVSGNAGAHYIAPGSNGSVPVLTIDSLELDACDLICLDVEGYEPLALRGAEQTIRKFRPAILIEEKGLSEQYYGIPRGTAENWVLGLGLGYSIREKRRADVILSVG